MSQNGEYHEVKPDRRETAINIWYTCTRQFPQPNTIKRLPASWRFLRWTHSVRCAMLSISTWYKALNYKKWTGLGINWITSTLHCPLCLVFPTRSCRFEFEGLLSMSDKFYVWFHTILFRWFNEVFQPCDDSIRGLMRLATHALPAAPLHFHPWLSLTLSPFWREMTLTTSQSWQPKLLIKWVHSWSSMANS